MVTRSRFGVTPKREETVEGVAARQIPRRRTGAGVDVRTRQRQIRAAREELDRREREKQAQIEEQAQPQKVTIGNKSFSRSAVEAAVRHFNLKSQGKRSAELANNPEAQRAFAAIRQFGFSGLSAPQIRRSLSAGATASIEAKKRGFDSAEELLKVEAGFRQRGIIGKETPETEIKQEDTQQGVVQEIRPQAAGGSGVLPKKKQEKGINLFKLAGKPIVKASGFIAEKIEPLIPEGKIKENLYADVISTSEAEKAVGSIVVGALFEPVFATGTAQVGRQTSVVKKAVKKKIKKGDISAEDVGRVFEDVAKDPVKQREALTKFRDSLKTQLKQAKTIEQKKIILQKAQKIFQIGQEKGAFPIRLGTPPPRRTPVNIGNIKSERELTIAIDLLFPRGVPSTLKGAGTLTGISGIGKQIEDTTIKPIERTRDLQIFTPLTVPSIKIKSSTESKVSQTSKSQQRTLQIPRLSQPSAQVPRTISPQVSTRFPLSISTPKIPKPKVPKTPIVLPSLFFGKAKTPKKKSSTIIQIKRGGRFTTVGRTTTLGQGISLGATRTGRDIAATFRVIPEGRISGRGFTPKGFKKKRRQPFTFVERKEFRLDTPSEISTIQKARRKKR